MAINFTTGTINEPDAGSVGLSMVEKIRDDVVLHAAWELVEEFTPASGLVRWYVFKCLAAVSGLSADYFVVVGRTLGSGELRAFVCEGYNSSTHTASFYGTADRTSVVYDSSGRCSTDTYILSTAVITATGNAPEYVSWIPSGTSTKWWITVCEDGFTVAFNGASNGFIHCGTYTSLSTYPNSMPIQIIGSTASSGVSSGHITRNPAVANATITGAALIILGGGAGSGSIIPLGFIGDLRYNDKLQGDQRAVAELGIVMTIHSGLATDSPLYGWVLGKHNRMRLGGGNAPAGFAFGDAYALQGRLWVPYLPTDLRMWDTGMAI